MKNKFLIVAAIAMFSSLCYAQQPNTFAYCKNTPLHFGKGILLSDPWQGSHDLFQSFQTDSTNSAGSSNITYTIVQNSEQLRTSLNQKDYLSVSYLGNSLTGSYGVNSNSYSNSSSITYAITGSCDYGTVTIKNPVLNSAAKFDSSSQNWTGFVNSFGDNYIDQISIGVSFTVFITLSNVSSGLQSQVNASIAANGGFGPLNASASASFSRAVQSSSSSGNLQIQIAANGADFSGLSNLVNTACTYTNSIDSITSAIATFMKTFNIRNSLITAYHYTPMRTLPGINITNNALIAGKVTKLTTLYDHYYDIAAKITLLNYILSSSYYKDFHNASDSLEAIRLLAQYNSADTTLISAYQTCMANPCSNVNNCCYNPTFVFNDALINKFLNMPFSDCTDANPDWSEQYTGNNTFTFTSTKVLSYAPAATSDVCGSTVYSCTSKNTMLAGQTIQISFNGSAYPWGDTHGGSPFYLNMIFADSVKGIPPYNSYNSIYSSYLNSNQKFSNTNTLTVGSDGLVYINECYIQIWYWGTTSFYALGLNQGATISISVPNLIPAINAIITPGETTICQGNSDTLQANACSSCKYSWHSNDVTWIGNGQTTPSISVNTGGNYFVTVTDTVSGSSNTSYWSTVTVKQPPAKPSISGLPSFCSGSSDTLTAYSSGCSGCTYTWLPPTNETGSTIIATTAGTYTVAASNGCSSPDATKTITVTQTPAKPSISGLPSFCLGSSDTLTAYSSGCSGCTYIWLPTNETGSTIIATTSGTYTVAASNGCSSTSLPKTITVTQPPIPIITISGNDLVANSIPNAKYQWYKYDTIIKGETRRFYTITSKGYYMVGITDANGCTGFSADTLLQFILGINELSVSQQINIYPNPTFSLFTIDFKNLKSNKNIQVFDITGKLIQQLQTDKNELQINLEGFAKGIYFLRIISEQGSINSKIILE